MTIIDGTKIMVDNEDELRLLLETENYIETFFLPQNGIQLTKPISILPTKKKIIIDGNFDSQNQSLAYSGTVKPLFSVGSDGDSELDITFQNLRLSGNSTDYIFTVSDTHDTSKVTVTLRNVDVLNCELIYNPLGLTRILDLTGLIMALPGSESALLVAREIEFGGHINFIHELPTLCQFKSLINNSFKILPYSQIRISCDYGSMALSSVPVTFEVGHDAIYSLSSRNISHNEESSLRFRINERGQLLFGNRYANNGLSPLYCSDYFIMEKNSVFSGDRAMADKPSPYIVFQKSVKNFILNNPAKFALSNFKTEFIGVEAATINFHLEFSQLNLWGSHNVLISGSINMPPTYYWYSDTKNTIFDGNFDQNQTTITSHNLTPEELSDLPNLSNFSLTTIQALSIGTLPLNVYPIDQTTTLVEGVTSPNASVLITYDSKNASATSDADGKFNVSITSGINFATPMLIITNIDRSYLFRHRLIKKEHLGELSIHAISPITYELNFVYFNPSVITRDKTFKLTIIDSRKTSTPWQLLASIDNYMVNPDGDILTDELQYFADDGSASVSLNKTPMVVYEGTDNGGTPKSFDIDWKDKFGILLKLNHKLMITTTYKTNINWLLQTVTNPPRADEITDEIDH